MGLFSFGAPKISQAELQELKGLMKQVQETTKLINTTTNPEVQFGRLHFLFDLFLKLKRFEKYNVFTGSTPTKDYNKLSREMEKSVNDFITRTYQKQIDKMSTLKSDKAKENSFNKYAEKMRTAFNSADTYWSGNLSSPHYTGKLYTSANLSYLESLLNK